VTLFLAKPPDGVLDQSGQLIPGAVDGLVYGRGLVSDRDGLPALQAGFHHATHRVMADLLVAVLVTQVDFQPRDVMAESAQGTFHYATDLSGQGLVTFDVVTRVYLNLHGVLLLDVMGSISIRGG
jgi:hypothetical protein